MSGAGANGKERLEALRNRADALARQPAEELTALVDQALASNKAISLVTYYLSDAGEQALHIIVSRILARFNRPDLLDILYTSLKELVMNAGKANLKRIIFDELGLDPLDPQQYEEGMVVFKKNLPEKRIRHYKPLFREYNLPVTITFYYEPFQALKIKVKNVFTLWPVEEERIRTKFRDAQDFTDLMQFYLAHGDETEGAGMGLTLVGILLDQTGIDRHHFALYSSRRYGETIARLEIPLSEEYESRRDRFEREWKASGLSRDEFRAKFGTLS